MNIKDLIAQCSDDQTRQTLETCLGAADAVVKIFNEELESFSPASPAVTTLVQKFQHGGDVQSAITYCESASKSHNPMPEIVMFGFFHAKLCYAVHLIKCIIKASAPDLSPGMSNALNSIIHEAVAEYTNVDRSFESLLSMTAPRPSLRANFFDIPLGTRFRYTAEENDKSTFVKLTQKTVAQWDDSKILERWDSQEIFSASEDGEDFEVIVVG